VTQDVFRYRAKQQLAQTGAAVGTEDDEIDLFVLDDSSEVLPDLAVPNVTAMRYGFQAAGNLVEFLPGLGVGIFVDRTHADVVHASGHHQDAGVREDVGDVQDATKVAADGRSVGESRFRSSREIGGKENVLYRKCGG